MTDEITLNPGDVIHFLKGGITFRTTSRMMPSEISERGQDLVITEKILLASIDGTGNSWLTLVSNEKAQQDRWNEIRFRLGPAPVGMLQPIPDPHAPSN
jgi:hypothetical protein